MKKQLISMVTALSLLTACGGNPKTTAEAEKIDYTVEQFADLQILRYRVPGFEDLSLKQKELVYYLCEAAYCGWRQALPGGGAYGFSREFPAGWHAVEAVHRESHDWYLRCTAGAQ